MTRHPINIANTCEEFIHATENRFKEVCVLKDLNAEERQILAEEVGICLSHVSHEVDFLITKVGNLDLTESQLDNIVSQIADSMA